MSDSDWFDKTLSTFQATEMLARLDVGPGYFRAGAIAALEHAKARSLRVYKHVLENEMAVRQRVWTELDAEAARLREGE